MSIIFLLIFFIIVCFGFVIIFGAPYLPTTSNQQQAALGLLNLKPGQKMADLGCGDGRVLIAAAKKGIYSTGYEINPIMAIVAWLATIRYRKYVRVVWGNFWSIDISQFDGVYVFLLDKYMSRLNQLIINTKLNKPLMVASYAFKIPGKKPAAQSQGVWLYLYKPIAKER